MTLSPHGLAIAALCATSLLVRVLPVFVRPRLNAAARNLVERVLPLAVFINFVIYIAWVEIHTAPVPALISIAAVTLTAFFTRLGLVTITCAATLVYVAALAVR